MALVVNGKVSIEYDTKEETDFGITLNDCSFIYDENFFSSKSDRDSIIKKLPISAETKNILLSRKDALGDIIRYANPKLYEGEPKRNKDEQPIEDVLDSDVLAKLTELIPDANNDKDKDLAVIKEKLKPVLKNMDKAKREKIINFVSATNKIEDIYTNTSELRIQFNTADKIAECMGVKNNDIRRLKAYAIHSIEDSIKQTGDSYIKTYFLKSAIKRNLKNRESARPEEMIKYEDIDTTIQEMTGSELIFDGLQKEKCYTKGMWEMEKLISEKLAYLSVKPAKKYKEDELKIDEKLDETQDRKSVV